MVLNKEKPGNDHFKKIIIISIFLFLVFLIISLFLLFVSPYFLYGCLYGGGFLFLSLFFILLIQRYITFKKHPYLYIFSILLIRSIILVGSMILLFLVINVDGKDSIDLTLKPVDFYFYFIVYLFYNLSNFLVIIFDRIILKVSKKSNHNGSR
ncbi:MAG: hypothetical protein HPAVJP_0490 [Candidatus Hepatoplasma vulgare]|nr:MAG: hypothetical protein HPAVJP_0490 [Candidatus Hepatoplasma sp.]